MSIPSEPPRSAPPEPTEPTGFRPLLWAVVSPPLWMMLALVPAALLQSAAPSILGYALLGGVLLATAAVRLMDVRLATPVPAFQPRWRAPAGWMYPAAVVAGVGVTILGSELGNVSQSLLSGDVVPAETQAAAPAIPGWQLALTWSLLHPVGLVMVLHGISQRRLQTIYSRKAALLVTVGLGAMILPGPVLQWAAVLALPAWLYAWTRSLGLAALALLPSAQGFALGVLGIPLGIEGFDLVDPNQVVFQPVWFDLLGAALLAAGVFPFLRVFEPAPPARRP